jgi:hypothetical protein
MNATDEVGSGDDQIRITGHDVPRQIRIALMMPLSGIAFDAEILSLDVTEPAQLSEKRAPRAAATGFREEGSRNGRMENRDPGLCRALLRPCRPRCSGKQQTGQKFPPPHCAYAPERPSNEWIVSGYDGVAHGKQKPTGLTEPVDVRCGQKRKSRPCGGMSALPR